jgi:hypothetical protein
MPGITPPKAASMPSGRSCPEPSADLFTADERLVLRGWFSTSPKPPTKRILSGWKLGRPPPLCSALDVAVAVILLERVQIRHPRLGALVGAKHDSATGTIFTVEQRQVDQRQSGQAASIVSLARHLFTLRWGDQRAPGVFWPSTYTATPVPGTDKIVLTESDDGESSFPVANATAIGWVSAADDFPGAIGGITRRRWSTLRDQTGQARWLKVAQPGLLDEGIVTTWADAVWP